jgi:hypothetical protein
LPALVLSAYGTWRIFHEHWHRVRKWTLVVVMFTVFGTLVAKWVMYRIEFFGYRAAVQEVLRDESEKTQHLECHVPEKNNSE